MNYRSMFFASTNGACVVVPASAAGLAALTGIEKPAKSSFWIRQLLDTCARGRSANNQGTGGPDDHRRQAGGSPDRPGIILSHGIEDWLRRRSLRPTGR